MAGFQLKPSVPLVIAGIYTAFGGAWIMFSDRILTGVTQDPAWLTQLQTYNGWFFILASAVLLFVLIKRAMSKQIQADQALIESESRFNQLTKYTRQTFYIVEWPAIKVIYASPAYERTWGRSLADLYADVNTWRDSIHPEDLEAADGQWERITSGSKEVERIYRIIRPDGRIRWIRDQAYAVRVDDSDKPVRIVGVSTDITKQKEIEESLVRSEAQYHRLIETMPVAVFTVADEHITYANPAALDLFEAASSEDLFGRNYFDLVHPEDQLHSRRRVELLMDGGDNVPREKRRYVSLTGKVIYVESAGEVYEWDGREVLLATAVDMTEQIAMEQAREKSRQIMLAVLEGIDANVFVSDVVSHEILYMNRHMMEQFGDDLTGRLCHQALHRLDNPCPQCTNSTLIDQRNRPTGPKVWSDFNPVTERWYMHFDRTVEWIDGRSVNLQVATDITELKETEEKRAALEAQLRQAQKMEAVGSLAGGIAHDFNNILQAIGGYVQLLEMNDKLGQEERRVIERIARSVGRAADLVQRLLAFGRKVEPSLGPVDLNRSVAQTADMLRRLIPKMIAIEVESTVKPAMIMADAGQIEQILLNLGVNAGDAMSKGGRVTITINQEEIGPDSSPETANLAPGQYIRLTVADEGPGVAEKDMEHIFEPFYSTKELGQGAGLGLAVVYAIAAGHSGRVTCRNRRRGGAEFSVYLPVYRGEPAEPEPEPAAAPEQPRTTTKVLLVDDEVPVLETGAALLENLGCQVFTAESGEAALEFMEQNSDAVQVIILDLGMPGMGGRQALARFRAEHPDKPVIVASGYSNEATQTEVIKAGAVAFMAKPYRAAQLAELITNSSEAPNRAE